VGDLLKLETLALFLVFAVPGIVALYVRAQFLTGRLPPVAEAMIAYLTVSVIYHALAYPVARPLYGAAIDSGLTRAGWFLLLFLGPALLGLLLGLNVRKGWAKAVLTRLGLQTVHPVDSAWDWHFGRCEECWVLAVLKDGTQWAGHMGPNSFMSSSPAERDIYIETVYEVAEKGRPWVPRTSSVWIAQGELQSLEFWPIATGEQDVQR